MFNRPLSSFLPAIYDGVVEMSELMNAEEKNMDIARIEMSTAFANTFVLTANESGVIMFEKMLNIIVNTAVEDLEFRRQRIINRLSMSPPFTFKFLKNKLDEIIGKDAWVSYIDFDNYTLYVEASAVDQNWYSEIEFTVNRIKPCNMVFVNVPLTTAFVKMSEEISLLALQWLYKLGSWKLGQNPFARLGGEGGVIKMPGIKSIESALLNDTAGFVVEDVAAVLINDTIKISDFNLKYATGNSAVIQYSVTPDMTNIITNIKLLKADDTVLTQSAVYVPVTQPVFSKHTITIMEGV